MIKTLIVTTVMVLIAVLVSKDLLEMEHLAMVGNFPSKISKNILPVISCLCYYTFHFSFKLDVDECSEESDPCDENADCINNDGSYSCTCKQGFTGDGVSCSGMLYSILFYFYKLPLYRIK